MISLYATVTNPIALTNFVLSFFNFYYFFVSFCFFFQQPALISNLHPVLVGSHIYIYIYPATVSFCTMHRSWRAREHLCSSKIHESSTLSINPIPILWRSITKSAWGLRLRLLHLFSTCAKFDPSLHHTTYWCAADGDVPGGTGIFKLHYCDHAVCFHISIYI